MNAMQKAGAVIVRISGLCLLLLAPALSVDAQNYGARTAQAQQAAAQYGRSGYYGQNSGSRGGYATGMGVGTVAGATAVGAAYPSATGLYGTSARPVAASASLTVVRQALTAFAVDMGRLPSSSEGLNALLTAPPGARNWQGPYISVSSGRPPFVDPWGNPYRFFNTSSGRRMSFLIKSNGPDGLPDTRDDLSVSG